MALLPTVVGDSSWSETHHFVLQQQGAAPYETDVTLGTSVPVAEMANMKTGTTHSLWKTPLEDSTSFEEVKKSGSVRMTNYDVGRKSVTNTVVALPRVAERLTRAGMYSVYNGTFYDRVYHDWDHTSHYSLQADYDRLRAMFPSAPLYFHEDPEGDLTEKINVVMGRVVSDLNSSYDLLTEVMELRQSVELVNTLLMSAISPIRTIRKLIKSGKIRVIGDWWLRYRYGIMPIVYSIQDIAKTLEERSAIYRTARAHDGINSELGATAATGTCFYDTYLYNAVIRGTGKEKITGADLARLHHRVQMNPLSTAWELVPFSFVVDWFTNVSDWITAQSSILSNIGTERKYCYSVRVSKQRRVYFRDGHDDRRTLTSGGWTVEPYGVVYSGISRSGGIDARADYEVLLEEEESYQRRVFQPTQVTLSFSPFLNWKRWADGVALSASKTRQLLRRR